MSGIRGTNLQIVTNYGIHWASSGVAYLEQSLEKAGTNAIGIKDKSPFVVQPVKPRQACNHLVPMASPKPNEAHIEFFMKIIEDPLARAMMPLPKPEGHSGIWFLPDPENKFAMFLSVLSKMSSPIHQIIQPIFMQDRKQPMLDGLQSSNVQPMIVTHLTASNTERLNSICAVAEQAPRRLILTGQTDVVLPQGVERVMTNIDRYDLQDLIPLPWESLGAFIIKKHMRNEFDA